MTCWGRRSPERHCLDSRLRGNDSSKQILITRNHFITMSLITANKQNSTYAVHHPIEITAEYDPAEWEAFVPNAVNGTLFHQLRFLEYHPVGRWEHHHLTFRRKGNLAAVFPACVRDEEGVRTLVSHQGASYGGPAWSPKLQYHHLEEIIRLLVDYARKSGFRRIKMTPPPVIYSHYPEQPLDFALFRNGFKPIRQELTQAVRLDVPEESMLESYVNKTRTAVRKAVNGNLAFRIIADPTQAEFDRFWEILVENRIGLGVVPTHNREEIERLHRLVPDKLMMAVIEDEGKMIAVIWNFICTPTTVLEFYMAHLAEYQQLRPVPYLTYHTMLWAKRAGFRWLDFGISSIWGEPTWGLLTFKENFGSKHFLRITYQIDI